MERVKEKKLPAVPISTTEKGSDIGFLINDSKNTKDADFAVIKNAIEEVINLCSFPNTKFFLVGYHDAAETICGPTELKDNLIEVLRNYVRKNKGGSAMHAGLDNCHNCFIRSDVHRKLFVFTGTEAEGEEWKNPITKLRKKNVEIFGIGIGKITLDKIKQWSTPSREFLVTEFDTIKEIFRKQLNLKETKIEDYEVSLSVLVKDYPVCLGEDLHIEIHLRNTGRKEIPANTEMKIVENSYFDSVPVFFEKSIKKGQTAKEKIIVPAKGEKKANLLPEYLEVAVSHPSVPLVCKTNAVKLYSELFIKDFLRLSFPIPEIQYINLLCFGVAGSGKSSFINSLMTSLNEKVVRVAAVGGDLNHVTNSLTRFSLADLSEDFSSVPINIFDIWGMDSGNYQNSMFLDVLKGKLPQNYQMKDRTIFTNEMKKEQLLDAYMNRLERAIHSVIFFMPYNIEDNPLFTAALADNFRICTKENQMNPVVVVTRASLAGDSAEQEMLKRDISRKFNIPANQIFMYDNYVEESDKTMSIDRKTLEILQHTILSATSYQKFYKKNLLEMLNEGKTTDKSPNTPKPVGGKIPVQNKPPAKPTLTSPAQNKPPPKQTQTPKTVIQSPKNTPKPTNTPPKKTPPSTLLCPKCKDDVEPDWNVCPNCEMDLSSLKNGPLLCSTCEYTLKPTFKICPKCKTPVPPPGPLQCPDCGDEVEPDWNNCPNCECDLPINK